MILLSQATELTLSADLQTQLILLVQIIIKISFYVIVASLFNRLAR